MLLADGVKPDCEWQEEGRGLADIHFIHRSSREAEIYFVANRSTNGVVGTASFRVDGLAPELWDAVTGEQHFAAAYEQKDGRTALPLDFSPCGSWFVVFREAAAKHPATAKRNTLRLEPGPDIAGAWTLAFDPKWGGPASIQFDSLVDWTRRPEASIKYYSGTATYRKTFDFTDPDANKPGRWFLNLGEVRERVVRQGIAPRHGRGARAGVRRRAAPPGRAPAGARERPRASVPAGIA